jgi:hypothetical protein
MAGDCIRYRYCTNLYRYITAVANPWSEGGALILIVTEGRGRGKALVVPLLATAFYNTKFWR